MLVAVPPGLAVTAKVHVLSKNGVGEKPTVAVQCPPGDKLAPQVLPCRLKEPQSAPESEKVTGPVGSPPALLTFKVNAREMVESKSNVVGETTNWAGVTPVPNKGAVMVPPGLPDTFNTALLNTGLVGAKRTETVQVPPAGSGGQLVSAKRKSATLEPDSETTRAPVGSVLTFLTVKVVGKVCWPTIILPNGCDDGVTDR